MGASKTDQAQQTRDDDQAQQTQKEKNQIGEIDVDKRLDETRSEDDDREMTEKPEVTDAHRKQAKEDLESYEENRPTVTLPGSDNTVAGTAINDWLDDDGNPKYGQDSDTDAQATDSDEKQPQEQSS